MPHEPPPAAQSADTAGSADPTDTAASTASVPGAAGATPVGGARRASWEVRHPLASGLAVALVVGCVLEVLLFVALVLALLLSGLPEIAREESAPTPASPRSESSVTAGAVWADRSGPASTADALEAGSGPATAPPSPVWGWPVAVFPAPVVLRAFTPPAQRWDPGDRGVDLAAAPGSPVLAPSAGEVTYAGTVGGRGVVVVRAASGLRSSLLPVDAAVAVGQQVRRGQVVGAVSAGAPWCGEGPCLHWGVLTGFGRASRYRDPLTLLAARAPVLLPLRG